MFTRHRLFSVLPLALFCILMALLTGFLRESRVIERTCLEHIRTETELQTRMSALLIQRYLSTFSADTLQEFVTTSLRPLCDAATRITVLRIDGTVLADSWENARDMPSHRDRPELQSFVDHDAAVDDTFPCTTLQRYSTTTRQQMLYCVTSFGTGEGTCLVRTSIAVGKIDSIARQVRQEVTILSIFAMALAACLVWLLYYWFTQPLNQLIGVARKVADGSLESPLPEIRHGSFRQIALSISRMSDRIQGQMDQLRRERILQDAVLDSLQEAVLLTDSRYRILHLNARARHFLSIDGETARKCTLCSLWRSVEFDSFLGEVTGAEAGDTEPREVNLTLGERQIHLLAQRIEWDEATWGLLFVLYDRSRECRLETVRRDFIANLSHELKTPLTVIAGATETLKSDRTVPESLRPTMETLAAQSTRLDRLMNDVLSLARLESEEMTDHLEQCELPITDTVEIAVSLCQPLADGRGMTLTVRDESGQPPILFDPGLMEQVFVNLLENAIKYSREKDTIEIRLSCPDREKIRITVTDHGPGVPLADQKRVFERFYRVDRSRSRASGGTGLGLAIVKHIVQLHRGRVAMEPSGTGAVFVVELPVAAIPASENRQT